MFCPSCAAQLRDIGAYCPYCGKDLQPSLERLQADSGGANAVAAVPWGGLQVVLGLVLVGVGFLVIGGSIVILEGMGAGLAWGAWLGSHAIGLVIIAAVALLGRARGPVSPAALGLRRPRTSWPAAVGLAVLALLLSIGFTALYGWAVSPFEIEILAPPDVPREIIFNGYAAVWTFEALALWTPLTEELFFRGFVMPGLAARWGVAGAAVASALIFSLFHLHPGVLVPIFFTGLLLAALYHVTGSLWPPVLAHAGQNATALTVIFLGG